MSKLLKSSGIFAAMTFISRILGLVRDIILAKYFDAGTTDAFFVALRIPNTFRRFFAEGGFANSFVPVLNETKETQTEKELQSLINNTFGVLGFFLLILTALGILFAGTIIAIGFSDKPEQLKLATTMLQITFPYILFISLTAFCAGILNTYNKFALPAFIPALLNVSLISFALFFKDYFNPPSIALAWAVFVGGILQFVVQLPTLWRLKRFPKPKLNFAHKGVKKILKLMVPTLLGSSVGQINTLLSTALAAMLVTGSASWLYYSDRLVELPIAIIGIALGSVILPKLSALKASKDDQEFTNTITWALKIAFLVGTASATGLIILAYPLISTLFERGAFSSHDSEMASYSLQIFGFGAFCLIMVKVLAPGFYSRQDTKTPVKIGLFCIGINIVSNLLLFKEFGHKGIAFSSTLSSFLNMFLLGFFLYRKKLIKLDKDLIFFIVRVLIANFILVAFVFTCREFLLEGVDGWSELKKSKQIIILAVMIISSIIVYVLANLALGIKPKQLLRPKL